MASTKFTVNLDGIELSKAQATALNKEINAVVAKHIGGIIVPGTALGTKIIKDPRWWGIWLKKFATIEKLKLNKLTFKPYKLG
jgi:hypothetical protein